MDNIIRYIKSSIGKKQVVAVTGLILIIFVLGHLAGNLLVLLGPEAYNNYAKKLASLRPGLYVVEFGLALIFFIHLLTTYLLVLENIQARPVPYHVTKESGERSWATRLMPYTGTIIIVFVIYHLLDFTFVDHEGPRSILADGKSYGLYGVVYNAFRDPAHSLFYIAAMFSLGLHLAHGVQSFLQTFGWATSEALKNISNLLGFLIALLYSSIPVYVLIHPG